MERCHRRYEHRREEGIAIAPSLHTPVVFLPDEATDPLHHDPRSEGERGKTPLGFKVMAVLCFVGSLLLVPSIVMLLLGVGDAFSKSGDFSIMTRVIYVIMAVGSFVAVITFVVLGVMLFRFRRRAARHTAETLMVLVLVELLCDLMLYGLTVDAAAFVLAEIVLIATLTYIDPTLSQERHLQRTLRDMEVREEAEEGTLGLDKTGKGFIELDFFNLFWIFVICAFVGDMVESVYHVLVVDPGHWQDRAGVLYGPFSPIYGFGAVLMTIALNRFHNAHIIVTFLVSAVIGGAFEYFTSWFMQFAFGAVAWDYSGTFGNIGGRTNVFFMSMWGLLGVAWIKLLLPFMLRLVNLIPWKWRYTVTTVAAALMIVDGAMTLLALDFWYERLAGHRPDNALAEFFARHYDNAWMADRFQSMSIIPDSSTRTR